MCALTLILISTLSLGCPSGLQDSSSAAHVEALIQKLGTGNIREEDGAKLELMGHPTPDSLPVLLQALASSEATVRDNIIEILAVYKDPRKIPALIAYKVNAWGDKNVDPQLVELGAPAVDALVNSLPNGCDRNKRESNYADWAGSVLREIEPDGTKALLMGLVTQQACKHEAARSGLIVARPGPPMAPPATAQDEVTDAGLNLLVDAAEHEDPAIRGTAVRWIESQQRGAWANLEYSEFLEALIETYRTDVSGETRTEIARMLAANPCVRVDRFMRAAVHSPIEGVRTIALKYLGPTRPSPALVKP